MMKYSRVYVEITNICNRNCSFCIGTKRALRRMTAEEFSLVTDRLQGITEYIYFHLMGEPLTHPLLPDFIREAREKGFHPAIATNGTLLATRGDSLIDADVYKVSISVHSFENGSTEEYLRYINDCMEFADKASRAGVLTVLRLWNRGYDEGRNLDTLALLRDYFKNDEWKEGNRGIRIRPKLHLEYGDRFEWPSLTATDHGEDVFCYGLSDHFGVLCDGSVVPCCLDHDGNMTLGNVFETEVSKILSTERARRIYEGFRCRKATEELCRRCGYAQRFSIK